MFYVYAFSKTAEMKLKPQYNFRSFALVPVYVKNSRWPDIHSDSCEALKCPTCGAQVDKITVSF